MFHINIIKDSWVNLWYLKCEFFKVCSEEGILVPGYLIFIEQWTLIQCSYQNVIKIWGWNKKFSEQIIYEAEYKCWKYRFNLIGEHRWGMVFIASLMTCWQCNQLFPTSWPVSLSLQFLLMLIMIQKDIDCKSQENNVSIFSEARLIEK